MSYINANTATFDGVDLTTINGLSILSINNYLPPRRSLNIYALDRTNRSKVNSGFYIEKNIIVKINLVRATRDLLETSIDSLMNILHGLEKQLIVKQSLGLRRYTASLSDTIVTNDGGAYCDISLVFKCSDSFGYDIAATLLLQVSGFTSGQKTDQISVGGGAPTQAPLITTTWSAITSGTNSEVVIGNDRTGQSISVTRTWLSGDVLEIDVLNRTVKVNNIEVDFSGAFPEFVTGIGYLSYADNFGSRTYSMTVTYIKRWS